MPSIRISDEMKLMKLMNDEETKRNVTDLEILCVSHSNGSLSLSGFIKLERLKMSGQFYKTLSVEISSTSLILSLMNRSSQSQNNRNRYECI